MELSGDLPEEFIGVFDSGAGGLSILAQARKMLPDQSFVYFGDSANTPYGEKSDEWVIARSEEITDALVASGAKAIVIACNTATAAAAATLREAYPGIPIIGVEPALKPATQASGIDRILVMATPMTLHLDKYQALAEHLRSDKEVIDVECPGLAARIEQGDLDAPDLRDMIEGFIGPFAGKVDGVVLGCTHYAFAAPTIRSIVGPLPLFDGAFGTARHLKRRLEQQGLLGPGDASPLDPPSSSSVQCCLLTSDEDPTTLRRYHRFLSLADEMEVDPSGSFSA